MSQIHYFTGSEAPYYTPTLWYRQKFVLKNFQVKQISVKTSDDGDSFYVALVIVLSNIPLQSFGP